jgi:hypothetical protein
MNALHPSEWLPRLTAALFLWLPSAQLLAGSTSVQVGEITFWLETSRSTFPPATQVCVNISVLNGTSHQLEWEVVGGCSPAFGQLAVIRAKDGMPVPCILSSVFQLMAGDGPVSPAGGPLLTESHDLTLTHGVSEAGRYFVRLTGEVPAIARSAGLSNCTTPPLQIEILDNSPSSAWNVSETHRAAGPVVDGLLIEAVMPARSFEVGDAIPVVVLLHNQSSTNRPVREPLSRSACRLTLHSESGQTVSLSAYARRQEKDSGAYLDTFIPPGGERWWDFRLDEWFELREPGTYTLEVESVAPIRIETPQRPFIPMPKLSAGRLTFQVLPAATPRK